MTAYNQTVSPLLGVSTRPAMSPLNKFRHANIGSELSQAEWLAASTHPLFSGSTGDSIAYDSAGHLSRFLGPVQRRGSDAVVLNTDYYSAGYEIQEAIDHISDSGGTLVLGSGVFNLPKALVAKRYLRIVGQGMDATTLLISGATNGIEVAGGGTNSTRVYQVSIENLTIKGTASSLAGLYAYYNYGPNRCLNVRFFRCGTYGAKLDVNGSSWIFDGCRFDSNYLAGIRLMGSTNPESFYDCVWSSNVEEGMLINGDTNEITIVGGNFNSNGKQALAITSATRTVNVTGVHFEINATAISNSSNDCAHVLLGSASQVYNVKFDNCWFNGEQGDLSAYTRNGIRVYNAINVLSLNSAFRKLTNAGFYIDSGSIVTHLNSTIVDNVPSISAGSGTIQAIQVA